MPKSITRLLGGLAASTAAVAAPLVVSTGTAHAASGDWDAVAQCESAELVREHRKRLLRWPAVQRRHLERSRWFRLPHNNSREEQIRVAEGVLASSGPGAWPSCGQYL